MSFGAEYGYPAGYSKMEPVTARPLLKDEQADISSAAAEIYAAATAVNDILMMQYVCDEMGMGFQLPFILQVDNQAACCFASQEPYSGKSKLGHVDQPSPTSSMGQGFETLVGSWGQGQAPGALEWPTTDMRRARS